MKVEWKDYEGVKYLSVSYNECKTSEELVKTLEDEAEIIRKSSNVLLLVNFEGAPTSNEFMDKLRDMAKEPAFANINKTAMLGMSGIKKIFFNTYLIFSNDKKAKTFDHESDAVSWLVS